MSSQKAQAVHRELRRLGFGLQPLQCTHALWQWPAEPRPPRKPKLEMILLDDDTYCLGPMDKPGPKTRFSGPGALHQHLREVGYQFPRKDETSAAGPPPATHPILQQPA